jgi:hypothetical protein
MKRFLRVSLVALVHLACSYVLWFVSMGIGMKSFDHPHVLTSSERIWTGIAWVLLRPIAIPLQELTRNLFLADPRYGGGVQSVMAMVWFLGPLVLNSVLWAALIWYAYSGLTRRLWRTRPHEAA